MKPLLISFAALTSASLIGVTFLYKNSFIKEKTSFTEETQENFSLISVLNPENKIFDAIDNVDDFQCLITIPHKNKIHVKEKKYDECKIEYLYSLDALTKKSFDLKTVNAFKNVFYKITVFSDEFKSLNYKKPQQIDIVDKNNKENVLFSFMTLSKWNAKKSGNFFIAKSKQESSSLKEFSCQKDDQEFENACWVTELPNASNNINLTDALKKVQNLMPTSTKGIDLKNSWYLIKYASKVSINNMPNKEIVLKSTKEETGKAITLDNVILIK